MLTAITFILDDMGLSYDVVNNNDPNYYMADPTFLNNYALIIWYQSGASGIGRSITQAEHDATEAWLQNGGRLLVTGYDCLGSPDDPLMADLVRSSDYGDGPFTGDYQISLDHPVTNGPYGVYPPGTAITADHTDHDQAEADTGRGGETIAQFTTDTHDKIMAAELASGGIVVYWNGNSNCADWVTVYGGLGPVEDKGVGVVATFDPTSVQGQNMLKNALAWLSFVGGDVPWIWEVPTTTVVPALSAFNVGIYFSAEPTPTEPLPLGTYTATLQLQNNDPVAGRIDVPVTMHIIDQVVTPTAAFTATSPACVDTDMWFYFSGDEGLPPADYYHWDFGDGMSTTVPGPDPVAHTYTAPGQYTATLEVCITQFGACDTTEGVVEVLPGPTAGFSWSAVTLTVTFVNESTDADAYLWDFGDGDTSTETHPVHTYPAEGTYTVTLTAYGPCGEDTVVDWVTVSLFPVAGFEHNAPVCLGEAVVFTNTSTGADTYLWEFGDGDTSTETHPIHLYLADGTYTVTLEACNALTCSTAMDWVEVMPLPVADFIYAMDRLTVTFTNQSMNTDAYLWDFGDGDTSTETNPVHVYLADGTYTVTLTATGPCGEDQASAVLNVTLCAQVSIVSVTTSIDGCEVTFGATLSGDPPFEYLWDFGAFGTSTETSPLVDFGATGTYTVTLEVWNCADIGYDTETFTVDVECVGLYYIYLPLVYNPAP